MAAKLFFSPFIPSFNSNGLPVAGASLTFYYTGTTTLAPIYADFGLATPLANPVVADAAARYPNIYLDDAITYRVRTKNASGAQIGGDVDPYIPGLSHLVKGDPGGNVLATGLFTALGTQTIPAGTDLIQTTGYDTVGIGAARYVDDALSNAALAAAQPRYCKVDAGGRYFRLDEAHQDVQMFGATGDGTTNDYAACAAAVLALPATGGTVIFPDAVGYKLGTTLTDGGKPVRFVLGAGTITGPTSGFIFDLQTNGSSIEGAGRGQTKLKLTAPASAPVMPTATATLTANAVSSVAINTAGSALHSTPIATVGASPSQNDAALIPTIAAAVLSALLVVAGGSGYAAAPAIGFIGGGAGAIKSNEILAGSLRGFSVDMSSIANAVGLYLYGGWYNDWADIDIIETSVHATAIPLVVDSHTLGVPGPTGSYGGAYVNYFRNIYASKVYVVGHDSSTATTFQFDTLDAKNILLHGAIATTFVNPVVQTGAATVFLDLVNADGVNVFGGDFEGAGTLIRARGSCNNVRLLGPLAYAFSGTTIYGPFGPGWEINLAKANSAVEPLRTGSGGNAGWAFQNNEWAEKHRLGIHYSGDTVVLSSNMKMLSPTTGDLDNVAAGGTVICLTSGNQVIIKTASAGANPRTLTTVAQFDTAGLTMNNATFLRSSVAWSNGAGASAGTLTNAPAVGNPSKWLVINDNGVTRHIPSW